MIRRRRWEISENLVSPAAAMFDRRRFIATGLAAMAGSTLPLLGCNESVATVPATPDPTADLYPAPANSAFHQARALTPIETSAKFNNYFEFGSDKRIAREAQALEIRPWEIRIEGLVEKEITLSIDDLIRQMPLEERIYRHRCVETWAMVVPWTGFPLAELVKLARPLGSAKFLLMESFKQPKNATNQQAYWYPWPYHEGLRLDEAMNELAFLVTGAYGQPLLKQFGAPLRLALPWKYGFKSIKGLTRFRFVEKQPQTFWEKIGENEYGFWANINPRFPHDRWDQDEEWMLGTREVFATELFNGYDEEVAAMYDLKDRKFFY